MVTAQLYICVCTVACTVYEMVAAQLFDTCGVLLLDKGVFCSMRW